MRSKKVAVYFFSLLTILCLGLIYGWSVFVAPLEEEFGWDRAETSMTFTISIVAMCIGVMLGGQFNKRKDRPFAALLIGAVMVFAGFALTCKASTIMSFYVFYGVFVSFGVGFSYVEMIGVLTKWFPKRQGLCSGLLMMCFGLGAMILGTISMKLVEVIGWRALFLALGLTFGIMLFVNGVLIGAVNKAETAEEQDKSHVIDGCSSTPIEMVKSVEFKLFYVWLICLSSAGLALIGHISPCAQQMGSNASMAAIITGVVSIANGGGRVIYGFAFDKLGVQRCMMVICAIFTIASLLTSFAVRFNSISTLIIGCVLMGLSFGAAPTASSTVINSFYGSRFFSSNFGIVSTQLIFSALLGPMLASRLYMASDSYATTFYLCVGLSLVAIVVMFSIFYFSKRNGRNIK